MKVHGIVAAVKDNGPVRGKFGTQYRLSFCIGDEWYGGFFSRSAAKLGAGKGAEVSFVCVQNGEFLNIDTKTFKVIEAALDPNQEPDDDDAPRRVPFTPKPKQVAAPAAYQSKNDLGIKVGHAINNAVHLAIASGDSSITNVAKLAKEVLALSVVLCAQAQAVIDEPRSVLREAVKKPKPPAPDLKEEEEEEQEQEQEEEEEEDPPAPAPKAKPKAYKPVVPPSFEDFEDDLPF